MNSEFDDISRPTNRFTGLAPYNGGEYGREPLVSGSKRSITENRQNVFNTSDGTFNFDTLLPFAIIASGLIILISII